MNFVDVLRPEYASDLSAGRGKFLDAVGKPIRQVTCGDVEHFLLARARDGRAPRTRNIYLASIRWLLRASGDVT